MVKSVFVQTLMYYLCTTCSQARFVTGVSLCLSSPIQQYHGYLFLFFFEIQLLILSLFH